MNRMLGGINRGRRFDLHEMEVLLKCTTGLMQEELLKTLVSMQLRGHVHMIVEPGTGMIQVWQPVDSAQPADVVKFLGGA
ncbi:hypothetical protein GCM10028801_30310 [Nocardioides maradonensis]